jgi:ADP-ribosyl-[dinitrogen reductase] hydrolase
LETKISLQDRYRGAMLGVLCGDALGAPYETWPSVAIRQDIQHRKGLVLFDYEDPFEKDGRFPAGRPTDDSEMTAALAQYYVLGDGTPEDLYAHFRKCVIEKQSYLCDLPAYGFGGTTRKALEPNTYAEGLKKRIGVTNPIPSNGALMRSAPVALRYRGEGKFVLLRKAKEHAVMTHAHSASIMTSILYADLMDGILAGKTYEEAFRATMEHYATAEAFHPFLELPAERPTIPIGLAGGAELTFKIAHWAVATSSSFEEGLTKTIMVGRDVDTYGAVAGGLLGALYGVDSIPTKWKERLIGGDRMISLADSLYDMSMNN